MFEALIVGVLLLVVAGFAVIPAGSALWIGTLATLVFFVGGAVAGAGYHIVLRRGLLEAHALEPGWYWDPVGRHEALSEAARQRVMPWFRGGVVSFAGCMLGVALVLTGALQHFLG